MKDIEFPMELSMHNTIRTGICSAENILSKKKVVKVVVDEVGSGGLPPHIKIISTIEEFEKWKELINRIEISIY